MRYLVLLLLLSLPVFLSAKTYKYDKVRISKKGSDYFSLDKITENDEYGYIQINSYKLHINGRVYTLRKKGKLYKSKGLMFRFTYKNAGLSFLEVFSYDKVYTYYIDPFASASLH